MDKIKVNLGLRSYDIAISDDFKDLPSLLKPLGLGRNACCITNSKVRAIFGQDIKNLLKSVGINLNFIDVPDTERSKSPEESLSVIRKILNYDKGERPFIIALGGGVVGDLAGYVASVYKRGIAYIQIPTTLLSQVDSSIGGKVGIDLPCAKNLIGSFYQPRLVYINISAVNTLPLRQFKNGLAEVVKYGVIKDKALFTFLEKNQNSIMANRNPSALKYIIRSSAGIKSKLVEADERDDKGLRIILNFGHTIGHSIEQAAGYSKSIYHGEAISMGMSAASLISVKLGLLDKKSAARIKTLLFKLGLPVAVKNIPIARIMRAQAFDKKFVCGNNRFVLPVKIGKVTIQENIPHSVIIKAIEESRSRW